MRSRKITEGRQVKELLLLKICNIALAGTLQIGCL